MSEVGSVRMTEVAGLPRPFENEVANRFARERHFRDDSRMVRDSATMNIMWIIHSTCLEIHLEEACGRVTTER